MAGMLIQNSIVRCILHLHERLTITGTNEVKTDEERHFSRKPAGLLFVCHDFHTCIRRDEEFESSLENLLFLAEENGQTGSQDQAADHI